MSERKEKVRAELSSLGIRFATWTPEQLRDAAASCRDRALKIRREPEPANAELREEVRAKLTQYERAADLCLLAASELEVT